MYQKEFENIITLICNKNSPDKLIEHLITDTELVKVLISKTIGNCFEFDSGRKIQTGYFATLCEVASIMNESENPAVKSELEKEEKWLSLFDLYINPIKQRFKEGLLVPPMNQGLNQGLNDFNNFNNFDQLNNCNSGEKDSEIMTKLPINALLKQLCDDYNSGKRADVIKIELDHNHKKEEMEILHDDEDDHYQYIHNDVNIHQNLLHQYGSEKGHSESHEFYDNNYWASTVIVDEVDLEDLLKS
jgi:hypothetical protein